MNAYSKHASHLLLFSVILIQESKENFADYVLLLLLTLDLQDHLEFQANLEIQVKSLCNIFTTSITPYEETSYGASILVHLCFKALFNLIDLVWFQ